MFDGRVMDMACGGKVDAARAAAAKVVGHCHDGSAASCSGAHRDDGTAASCAGEGSCADASGGVSAGGVHGFDQRKEDLARRVVGECRTSLMMAMRYLDVAFWKMPLEAASFEGSVATDGVVLKFDPANVIERFKQSPNEMSRDFLHLILHCVFRQPFETRREFPMLWSYACDLCVENIAIEACGGRFASARDADRTAVVRQLAKHVSALTPAQIYRLLVRLRADGAQLTLEEKQLAQLLRQSEALFIRDSHDFWNLSRPDDASDSDESDENKEGDDPQQSADQEGAGATAEDSDQEDDADEDSGAADADQGDSGQGSSGGTGQGESSPDTDDIDESNDAGGGGGQASPDAANEENDGESEEDSDEDSDGGAVDSSADDGSASSENQQPSQQEPNSAQAQTNQAPSDSSAKSDASQGAPQDGSTGADADFEQAPTGDIDPEQAERDWEKISKQIEADLQTMSQQRGSGAGDMLANLELANRNRVNYSDFLRQFARLGEDMRINDDEFDYVYYMYGLSRYGNMPLVEPLEYKESNRVREFVIALDTSGSCSGDLVRRFVEHTFSILKSSEEFGSQVNIHVIQCDADIQKDTVITSVDDFTRYLEDFEVAGFGGTDFRPVFAYVDDLLRQGEFEDLRGLIYFTDGAGVYPDAPPDYDVAFVFVDESGEKRRVPPWAMRVVMDEESIRQL